MTETKSEQQPHSFKRKLGNTTYIVKVHFSKNTDKTFKDRVQNLIINEFLEAAETLARRLELIGNIYSGGRPILRIPCRDLLEIMLEASR